MKIQTARKLAEKSASFHNKLLKRYKLRMEVVREGRLVTQAMQYDTIDDNSLRKEFERYEDYTRYRTFELVADEIRKRFSPEELSHLCVAEAGVYKGNFAWIINAKFPECEMYLYDTFDGFDENDLAVEANHSFSSIEDLHNWFREPNENPDHRLRVLKSKLKHRDTCHIRQGYFPDSADQEKEKRWAFVSLDMDLYQPMKAGLSYFWPRMVEGGAIFVHDFNNIYFEGVEQVVSEAEKEFGRIYKIPISDQGGTVVLCK